MAFLLIPQQNMNNVFKYLSAARARAEDLLIIATAQEMRLYSRCHTHVKNVNELHTLKIKKKKKHTVHIYIVYRDE